ncbi:MULTISPECIES: glucans biosynthesis glucosyltransferase MdoH [unclassified Beijerinckia]|uniref:glucans biosynthesis glucosyltransferase MdoH n=1 Tax=unclassified Beijerinckia TaxID=2638183 RepID=UPI0008973007|nr:MULTISPECIES: glucans biosynthesis glucosyltransferase MdoH [unclassified Beijerinckia]MDH7796111.1 membrane glycosyltransferase [Beijerinckia sp. GAS462]SEC30804.1 membrane glycosyltransferase [Beijerinckia sp. 28-YEA-48]
MDSVTDHLSAPTDQASSNVQDPRLQSAMPAEAPLAMPQQSLATFDPATAYKATRQGEDWSTWAARVLVFGGGVALTAYGANEMYGVINVGSITALKWALLVLFTINFSWIALSFMSAIGGFIWLFLHNRNKPGVAPTLTTRTAVVMPIYNEAPERVFGALQAMIEDVQRTGRDDHFDWFFLSDTTNPEVWIAEERAFEALRAQIGDTANVYYRHRPNNTARKAGNIADFVTRWGGHYEHMVVLDADSLMAGPTIVALVAAMEADPDAGIIQTLPLIMNRNTFLARLQQFAARIYGPIIAAGLALWSGRKGNYWGHNAIIRTRAFAACCGLPNLRGKPPFGGHILSHDFVEAALLVRAGYAVYMLPALGGSYEESPPSLIDIAARDRRWCQGNLQHTRLLLTKKLKLASRQHFTTGIMGYLSSPVWMAQLLVGIALVLQASFIRPEYFTHEFAMFPDWPIFDYERALKLFGVTMAVLLAPKFMGLLYALFRAPTRRVTGGVIGLSASFIIELIFSALIAPIMMVIQTGAVLQIVSGRDTGWQPQRRDDGSIPILHIVRRHRSHVALGFLTLIAGYLISPSLVAWMSPTIAGLILAIVISWASGQLWIGLALRRLGILVTPEETSPPRVATRASELMTRLTPDESVEVDSIKAVHGDSKFRALHEAMLPSLERHKRGVVDPARAVAEAKLNDAETITEAADWLKPRERMIVLHDRSLLNLLSRLKSEETAPAQTTG